MLEELVIKITTMYDNGGFSEAKDNIASVQTATGDMAGAYVVNMGDMADATESFNMSAAGNLEKVNDKIRDFNGDSEAAT